MAGDVANIALTTGKLGACPATDARDDVLEQAIVRARQGDLEAFDIIIRRSERRVVSVAWRILGDEDDARDAAQEVFLRVFRYLGSFRAGESFPAWLYRIAINTCRDARRGKSLRLARFPSIGESGEDLAEETGPMHIRKMPCFGRSGGRSSVGRLRNWQIASERRSSCGTSKD